MDVNIDAISPEASTHTDPSQRIGQLVQVLEHERQNRWHRWLRGVGYWIAWEIARNVVCMWLHVRPYGFDSIWSFPARIGQNIGFVALLGYCLLPSKERRNAVLELAAIDDDAILAPLYEQHRLIYIEPIRKAFVRQLGNLTPANRDCLSPNIVKAMREALGNCASPVFGSSWNEEYALAVIRATGQIGDERMMRQLEKLASLNPKKDRERRIKYAALDALPILKSRLELERASETLLRPAEESGAEPLLRPAVPRERLETVLLRPQ